MSPVKFRYGAARSGMAGELWLGGARFCAVRSCMVWYGWHGSLRSGMALCGMDWHGRL